MKGRTNVHTTVMYDPNELLTINVTGPNSGYEITISTLTTVGIATKYTKLEYIESTGASYINTQFMPNQNTKMYLDVAFLTAAGANVAGVRNTSSDTINRFGIVSYRSTSKLGAIFHESSTRAIDYDTSRHTYELSKSGLIVDGTSYGSSNSNSFTCKYPITLGAWNNGADGIACNISMIYACKIYDNDMLIRDYIPALREDGVAGLYDAVHDVFYTSAGSSEFVAGDALIEVIATQTTATATHKIPYNTTYTVSASDAEGYITPASQTFTASQSVRNLEVVYAAQPTGVFIQDIYGNLYTEDEWDGTQTANGVAVIAPECEFVMALTYLTDAYKWGDKGSLLDGILSGDKNTVKGDYNGRNNTEIMSLQGDDNIASAAKKRIFPNGLNGYVPSFGEWYTAYQNKVAVNSALSKAGGTSIPSSLSDRFWTSSQYDSDYSWYGTWYDTNNGGTHTKDIIYPSVLFAPLISPYDIVEFTCKSSSRGTLTFKAVKGTKPSDWEYSAFNTTGASGDEGDVFHYFMKAFSTEWEYDQPIQGGESYSFVEPL